MYLYLNERLNESDCDSMSCYANVAAYALNEAEQAEKEVEETHDRGFIAHFKKYKKAYLAIAATLGVSIVGYILWMKYGAKKPNEVPKVVMNSIEETDKALLSQGFTKTEIQKLKISM